MRRAASPEPRRSAGAAAVCGCPEVRRAESRVGAAADASLAAQAVPRGVTTKGVASFSWKSKFQDRGSRRFLDVSGRVECFSCCKFLLLAWCPIGVAPWLVHAAWVVLYGGAM